MAAAVVVVVVWFMTEFLLTMGVVLGTLQRGASDSSHGDEKIWFV
jgi:hypothetical protein